MSEHARLDSDPRESLQRELADAEGDLARVKKELRQLTQDLERRVAERTAETRRKTEMLRAMAEELYRTEDREQHRMAELIHDSIKQDVAGARMLLGTLRPHLQDERALANLEMIDGALANAIATCRNLTAELSPPLLRGASLAESLGWLGERFAAEHGFQVLVDVRTDLEPARQEMSSMLYRSVRELLFNVVKHAGVDRAVVRVTRPERAVLGIEVEDQGCGMDVALLEQPSTGGFGLFGIRERLELVGGRAELVSHPGDGTTVRLLCPVRLGESRSSSGDATVSPPARSARPAGRHRRDEPIRVLVADDHRLLRDGLVTMLEHHDDIEVVGTAGDGAEAVALAAKLRPDVVLMDVSMPTVDGVEATAEITRSLESVRVVGLSMHHDPIIRQRILGAGAATFLPKDAPVEEVLAAIRDEL